MEDNSKLFVFDKKEVVLIFVFIVLMAITAFTLGVRFGKQLSLKSDEYSNDDIDLINLKSNVEENVDGLVKDKPESEFEKSLEDKSNDNLDTESRLRMEIERLSKSGEGVEPEPQVPADSMEPELSAKIENTDDLYRPSGSIQGKYTIQLAAFSTQDEARTFADGFLVSGHDAVVLEVEIPGKGTWYRVSVGAFDSLDKAKEYLEKEKSFFQGKDYLINKIE